MGIFDFFKKKEPKHFMFEQPGTKVLLLPAKFFNHSEVHPAFSAEEQKELAELFKNNKVLYYTYSEPLSKFVCDPINVGEVFYADKNDLNNIPGEVSEFEFHKWIAR